MSTQPISVARLAANRANAQKSTGPRAAEGKAAVSNNALKHGLRSERNSMDLAADASLPYEQTQFLETLAAFKQDLAPEGLLETRLVERLAQLDHRLQRATRMDTAHLEIKAGLIYKSTADALPGDEQNRNNWLSTLAFLKSPNASTQIAQYESRLSRDLARTQTQFRQAQKLRVQNQAQKLQRSE